MIELSEENMIAIMDGHPPPEGVDAQREYYRVCGHRIAEHYPEHWSRRLVGGIPYCMHEFYLKNGLDRRTAQ